MPNKYMKKFLISLANMEMQIKTTLRCYLTPVKTATIKKTKKTTNVQGEGTNVHCWWECKLVKPLLKSVWKVLKKLKMELAYHTAIPLLRIFLKQSNSA
jgi:hypothetical protein